VLTVAGPKTHPDGRINPFALSGGDVLLAGGCYYIVTDGYDQDPSPCWTQSRWVLCTRVAMHPRDPLRGQLMYVNPTNARLARTDDEEHVIWLQVDAAHLYSWARKYTDQGQAWLAVKVQENAANSARLARIALSIESPRKA
jgi:hypothetical protein